MKFTTGRMATVKATGERGVVIGVMVTGGQRPIYTVRFNSGKVASFRQWELGR